MAASPPAHATCCHPSLISKREVLDRLADSIHYDAAAVLVEAGGEIDALLRLREEVVGRVRVGRRAVPSLEEERRPKKIKRKRGRRGILLNRFWAF